MCLCSFVLRFQYENRHEHDVYDECEEHANDEYNRRKLNKRCNVEKEQHM